MSSISIFKIKVATHKDHQRPGSLAGKPIGDIIPPGDPMFDIVEHRQLLKILQASHTERLKLFGMVETSKMS